MSERRFFVDMNAFFASVEQEERPELRGKPIIVTPVEAETTCAIAASYEAKALGISTGISVKAARRLCPEIAVIEARPRLYMQYHAGILEVLNGLFTSVQPLSVDEMACVLGRFYGTAEAERRLGREVKARFYQRLGAQLRCSVGTAPNVFLAKVAAERVKPDGLTVWEEGDLPEALFGLNLLDLPGIGPKMLARLERGGIRTVRELYDASARELRRAWGSVVGERWGYMLRGSRELDYGQDEPEFRKSVGHSHVLPPEFRSVRGAREIILRLFTKCLRRLRTYEQVAGAVEVWAVYKEERTHAMYGWRRKSAKHLHSNDDATWLRIARPMIEALPEPKAGHVVLKAGITFRDLMRAQDRTLSLFDDFEAQERLGKTVDALNGKYRESVGLASAYGARNEAPFRIAFGRVIPI